MADPINMTALMAEVAVLRVEVDELNGVVQDMWHTVCFMIAFFNQMGFCLLEAGTVRAKHVRHILLTNLLDSIICVIAWYLVGWGMAFGPGNGFIGTEDYLILDSQEYALWLIQLIFALTAVTIPSGVMVERNRVIPYLLYVCLSSFLMYPILAHWIWGPGGWLQQVGANGVLDSAGGLVVHSYAGVIALCATAILGPRVGRFDPSSTAKPTPHNYPLVMLGVWCLTIAWMAFNMGASTFRHGSQFRQVAQIAISTLIGGFTSGLTYFVLQEAWPQVLHFEGISSALLTGFAAMTSASALVEPWYGFPIGVCSALCFIGFAKLLEALKIDDPIDAVPVHLGGGICGVFWIGFVADPGHIAFFLGRPVESITQYGCFLGGGGVQLGVQLLGLVMTCAWASALTIAIYLPLRYFGYLRVSVEVEIAGLDNHDLGGSAYPDFKLN